MGKFTDQSGKSFSCPLLKGKDNYDVWSYTMRAHLETIGAYELVLAPESPKDEPIVGALAAEQAEVTFDATGSSKLTKEREAKSAICSCLSEDDVRRIMHCKTAREIWHCLEIAYGMRTSNVKLELMSELGNIQCKSAKDVPLVANRIIGIKNKLTALATPVDDTLVMSSIVKALPESLKSFLEFWNMLDADQQTLDRFITKLTEKAKAVAAQEAEEPSESARLALTQSKPGKPARGKKGRGAPQHQKPYNPQSNRQPGYQPTYFQSNRQPGYQPRAQYNNRPQQSYQYPRGGYSGYGRMQGSSSQPRFPLNVGGYQPPQLPWQKPQEEDLSQVMCHYCKEFGHYKSACTVLKNKLESTKGYNFGQQAKMAIVEQQADKTAANVTMSDSTWTVDSGCSAHMTRNRIWLTGYTEFESPVRVRLGDNRIVHSHGSGIVHTTFGPLKNVLYVPELGSNLLSVSSATKEGVEFRISAQGMTIFHKGKPALMALHEEGVYWLNLEILVQEEKASSALTLDHWHQRLGHMPKSLVVKMMKENVVDGIRIIEDGYSDCIDCKLNKCHRASHPLRSSMTKVTQAGRSLHFDVIGPIRPDGISGERFILVGKDEFSTYRFTECVKAKSKIPELVKSILTRSELQSGNYVLRIVTDNGSEFLSERLTLFLEQRGIEHVLSAVYVPQQNGRIERENRFLLDQSRTMINSAKLDLELWPEAVSAATYVSNRCITTNKEKTPFELWFGKKPDVKNLRIFGQQASVFKQDHMRSKFDMKGTLMQFVGYTDVSNTYKFFDPTTKKIIITCDALFCDRVGPIGTDLSVSDQNDRRRFDHNGAEKGQEPKRQPFDFAKADDLWTLSSASSDSGGSDLDRRAPNDARIVDETVFDDAVDDFCREGPSKDSQPWPEKTVDDERDRSNTGIPELVSFLRPNIFQKVAPAAGSSMQPQVSSGNDTPGSSSSENQPDTSPALAEQSSSSSQSIAADPIQPREDDNSQADTGERPTTSTPQPLRRSGRQRETYDYNKLAKGREDLRYARIAHALLPPPRTFNEIYTRRDYNDWLLAAEAEYSQMVRLEVFELVPRPNQNVISCRWVFTEKTMPDGSVQPKARLVARGFTQEAGIDYYATFAPVAHMDFVRFLFANAAVEGLTITQCDVKTAFLYGKLEETIYMEQPEGFHDGTDRVWHLLKSIYGLKQAPRCWGERFSEALRGIGLAQTNVDACIFYREAPKIIMAVYVDDAVIFSLNKQDAMNLVKELQQEFDVHIMRSSKFLGLQYIVHSDGAITLHQGDYIVSTLKDLDMWDSNPTTTPVTPGQRAGNQDPFEDNRKFREIVGRLQWASCQTRPDISFAVGLISRKLVNPTQLDFQIAKRILRYLRGTVDLGITYTRSNHDGLITYSDADFAGDTPSYKSTSGSLIFFGGSPISWRSKLQKNVATSTTEAEYIAVESAIKSCVCVRELGLELGVIAPTPVPVMCDNRGAVLITANETSVQRTRHLGAKLNYCREQHEEGTVAVTFVKGQEQKADLLTKALPNERFVSNRNCLLTRLNLYLSILALLCCVSTISANRLRQIIFESSESPEDENSTSAVSRTVIDIVPWYNRPLPPGKRDILETVNIRNKPDYLTDPPELVERYWKAWNPKHFVPEEDPAYLIAVHLAPDRHVGSYIIDEHGRQIVGQYGLKKEIIWFFDEAHRDKCILGMPPVSYPTLNAYNLSACVCPYTNCDYSEFDARYYGIQGKGTTSTTTKMPSTTSASDDVADAPRETVVSEAPSMTAWHQIPELSKPVKIDIKGFDTIHHDSDTLILKRTKSTTVRNTTLVMPTRHYVKIGLMGVIIKGRIRDFCYKYVAIKKAYPTGSIAFELANSMIQYCKADVEKIIKPAMRRLKNSRLNLIRDKRAANGNVLTDMALAGAKQYVESHVDDAKERVVKATLQHIRTQEANSDRKDLVKFDPSSLDNSVKGDSELPQDYDPFHGRELEQPMGQGWRVFNTITGGLFQPALSHWNNGSSENLVFVHEEMIKDLAINFNRQEHIMWKNIGLNRKNLENIDMLMRMSMREHDQSMMTIRSMPALLHLSSIVQIAIQRYADNIDRLREIAESTFRLDLSICQDLGWLQPNYTYPDTEDIPVYNIQVHNDERCSINIEIPIRDPNVLIFKIVPFKQWVDNFMFLKYTGPEYIMTNKTNNCTTFIEKPTKRVVEDFCLTPNDTISLEDGASWSRIDIRTYNQSSQHKAMIPEVFRIGDKHYVNCYRADHIHYTNNTILSLRGPPKVEVLPCNEGPYILSPYNNYTIFRGYPGEPFSIYNYEFTVALENSDRESLPEIIENENLGVDKEYNELAQQSINNLGQMHAIQTSMEAEMSAPRKIYSQVSHMASVYPEWSMAGAIMILGLITWCCTSYSSVIKMAFLTRVMHRRLEQEVTDAIMRSGSRAGSISGSAHVTPSQSITNIHIHNSPPEPTAPRQVNFVRNELYPNYSPNPSLVDSGHYSQIAANRSQPRSRRMTPFPSQQQLGMDEIEMEEIQPMILDLAPSGIEEAAEDVGQKTATALKNNLPSLSRFRQLRDKSHRRGSTISTPADTTHYADIMGSIIPDPQPGPSHSPDT